MGLGWAENEVGEFCDLEIGLKLTVLEAGLGWAGKGVGAGAGVLRLEPDFPKLGFATGN